MTKTLGEIVGELVGCGDNLRSCMVDAVLIRDEQARLKKALGCMTSYEKCKADAVKDVALTAAMEKLKRRLAAIEKEGVKSPGPKTGAKSK